MLEKVALRLQIKSQHSKANLRTMGRVMLQGEGLHRQSGVDSNHEGARDAFRHRAASTRGDTAELRPVEVNPKRKSVTVTKIRTDGFVEFDFSVGDPDIVAEMLLSAEAFERFCRDQDVRPTTAPDIPVPQTGLGQTGLGMTLREAIRRAGTSSQATPANTTQFPRPAAPGN